MQQIDKEDVLRRLENILGTIPEPQDDLDDDSESTRWLRDVEVALTYTFGEKSTQLAEFKRVRFDRIVSTDELELQELDSALLHRITLSRGLSDVRALLQSMVKEVRDFWPDEVGGTMRTDRPHDHTKDVFLVHGRDTGAKDEVARFLEKLDLVPLVLAELPSGGKTIIEKFEAHAEVGCAVVLLTPDDTGALRGEESRPRARQNVIFELGFFIGKLGRGRVCVLTKGDPEIPSDYAGVVYIPMDGASQWQMSLIRELKDAELEIDANRAFN